MDVHLAACATPEALPLVDASYAHPGSVEAHELRKRFCARCPIGAECLGEAMLRPEPGVWGGTSPKMRTEHGAPPTSPNTNWRRRAAARAC